MRQTLQRSGRALLAAVVLSAVFVTAGLTQTPRTVRVVTAKGQPYYISSSFLSRVAPPTLKFELIDAPTSGEAIDSLLTGNADVAYLGLITTILAVARDRPIVAVSAVGYKGTRIVARADTNIQSVKDLAGKNVGVSKSSTQDIILRKLLAEAGVDPVRGVNFILLPTNAHFEAMASKTVDAVTTSEPYGSFLLTTGVGRQIVADPYQTSVSGVAIVLAFSRDMIEKNPDFVQTIANLHAKATVYVNEHPEEVLREIMKTSRQTESIMKMAMENSASHYNVDDAYLERSQILIDELVKAKYLDKPVDLKKLFDLRFMPDARKEAGKIF